MPRRRRVDYEPGYFHVLNRSAGKLSLFTRPTDYRAFMNILRAGLEKHPVRLVSYCLMSNHWHLIVGPVGPTRLSQLLHWVTTTHAARLRRRRQLVGSGAVYQNRFKARPLETLEGLMRACRYVERHALAAGLVARAQDWPWCSLAARLLPDRSVPVVDTPFLASPSWVDYVNARRAADAAEGSGHLAEPPRAGRSQRRERLVEPVGRHDDDQPDAHVERPKRLGLLKPARMVEPGKQRRNRPATAVK